MGVSGRGCPGASAADADATWTGEDGSDRAGDSLHGGQDVDGDGRPDFVTGGWWGGNLRGVKDLPVTVGGAPTWSALQSLVGSCR
jgi:hypothetical protein